MLSKKIKSKSIPGSSSKWMAGILISLIGAALIFWGGAQLLLGIAAYFIKDGASNFRVRYFEFAPYINAPEEDTRPSAGQPAMIFAGILLVIVMNRRKNAYNE